MAMTAEAAREKMLAMMGACEVCGAPAVKHARKQVVTGCTKKTHFGPLPEFDAKGIPLIAKPGDFTQTTEPAEEIHRYCKAHIPKE